MTRAQHTKALYFIEAPSVGMVRIGLSTNIAARFWALYAGSPVEIRLRAACSGGRPEESALNKYLADDWSHCEWFRISARVEALLAHVERKAPLRDLVTAEYFTTLARPFGRHAPGVNAAIRDLIMAYVPNQGAA